MGFFILNPTIKLGLTAVPSTSLGTSSLWILEWVSYVWAGGKPNAQMFWQTGASSENVIH